MWVSVNERLPGPDDEVPFVFTWGESRIVLTIKSTTDHRTDNMTHESGSEAWLRNKAWFSCEHCEADAEPTVHRVADLKILDGKTICRECWDNHRGPVPKNWQELTPFEPFAFLNEER